MDKEQLKLLLLKRRRGELSVQEKGVLANILNDSSLQQMIEEVFTELILEEIPDETYDQQRFEPMLELAVDIDRPLPADQRKSTVVLSSSRSIWKWAAAAVLVLVSSVLFYFHLQNQREDLAAVQKRNFPGKDIAPGASRAILILENGSRVDLDSMENGLIASIDGSEVNKQNGILEYRRKEGARMQTGINTLSTPRGGQYQVVLPDGSKVWLNAASSLRYPTQFLEKQRKVELKGEAYFDIAPDKARPFIVQAATDEVIVLGTQFNMNAYTDEPNAKTTLVEGRVKVNGKILQPGQAYANGKIYQTNIDEDMAWKNGYFNLTNQRLESIMRQLERWYDIETRLEGNAGEVKLKGKMDRGMALSDLLYFLGEMRIKCKLEGRRLTIYGK